jgi:5-carboxymethyl-2-hydroxymuconate isomerase
LPHFIVEYSEDLAATNDLAALCQLLFDTAKSSGMFDPDAIKVRALPCTHWRIGTDPQSFAHITIRLMAGRDHLVKSRLSKSVLTAMDEHLPEVGSLTVDIKEIDPTTYAKRIV